MGESGVVVIASSHRDAHCWAKMADGERLCLTHHKEEEEVVGEGTRRKRRRITQYGQSVQQCNMLM